jgi:Outer membrane protein beta-barrel domain
MRPQLLSAIIITALTFFSLVPALQAQQDEQPPVDAFFGYSHSSNFDTGLNGWMFSGNVNFLRDVIGLEGDISGHYGSHGLGGLPLVVPLLPGHVNTNMYSFDFGPRYTWRSPDRPFNIFGHFLFGVSHANISATGVNENSDTAFSWVMGAGGDYNFRPDWAGRVQIDYLHTVFFSQGQGHPRFSLGVVYRFGSH